MNETPFEQLEKAWNEFVDEIIDLLHLQEVCDWLVDLLPRIYDWIGEKVLKRK